MVNVQVDGRWIKVKKGTSMIEACKQAQSDVPLLSPNLHLLVIVVCVWSRWYAPSSDAWQEPETDDDGHAKIS